MAVTPAGAPPVPSLLHKGVQDFLRRHAPFSQMSKAHLATLAASARLNYFAHGTRIQRATDGPAHTFFVIQRGEVRSYEPDITDLSSEHVTTLAPGECFPLGALIEGCPVINDYVAVSDTFCYEFDKPVFETLLRESAPFASFCTRRIAHLLQESWRHARAQAQEEAHGRHNMTSLLADLVQRSPVVCKPETPLHDVFVAMRDARIGAIIENRQKRIADDLAAAASLKAESDAAIAAYEKALADARARAQAIANETRDTQAAAAAVTRKKLEDELNAKLAEAEKTIAATKTAAMANVRGIAADATKAIVERLIGKAPADSAVDAAVTAALKS